MTDPLATRLAEALGPAYEVTSLLGKGGMGAVYRATDRRLRREVAVKVLPPELGYAAELRTRFKREAQMAAQLSHPNIVSVYDVGDREDLAWFTMAFVDGESLRAKVEREGPQPISVVRRVLREVAQALAYAHARGVIHRDIKPDNIIIDQVSGRAMVTDFGIAKALTAEDTEVTHPGEIVGTARYMAPEQALAEPVDARSDMYSLGLVGYFMVTGTHGIQGGSLRAVMAEYVKGAAINLKSAERRLPAPLVTALERALAPKPDGRFARMEEFAEALRDLGDDLPDTPAPVRVLLRETERVFVFGTITALALSFVGVENVPPKLLLFLVGGLVVQWAMSVERSVQRGVTWASVRRALYVERGRRVGELHVGGPTTLGAASGVALLAIVLGAGLLGSEEASTPKGSLLLNQVLFWGGFFGGILVARVFGMPRVRSGKLAPARTANGIYVALLLMTVPLVVWLLAYYWRTIASAGGSAMLLGLAFLGVPLALLGVAAYRLAKRLERKWGVEGEGAAAPHVAEWSVPRWLDVAGSWLFARIERTGWSIRIVRDRPVAASAARLGVSAARQVEKRVRRLAQGVTGSGVAIAWEARTIAIDLAGECRRAEQELKPLLAKIARLNEGVLVSRTVAGGGSIESELDQAERNADALKGHAKECGNMLDALVAGLEGLVASKDTAALDSAIRRGRQLSSGVRRLILRAEEIRTFTRPIA